jgi:hypothetical protein
MATEQPPFDQLGREAASEELSPCDDSVLSLGEPPNHLRCRIALGNPIRNHPKRIRLGGDIPRIVMHAEGGLGSGGHTPTLLDLVARVVRGNC